MKVIMLAGKGVSTKYIYNGIEAEINIDKILITESVSSFKLIKRRIKKLGFLNVFNQLIFQIVIVRLLQFTSQKMLKKRKEDLLLKDTPLPVEKIIEVFNVNSDLTLKTIKMLEPDVIIVNGTSIIEKKILECTSAIFINTHVGITPQYRGVHGGYWSIRNIDEVNFGVTVHIVDKGIDTGSIIYQHTTIVEKEDNFLSYPLYQYALAIPLIKKTLKDIQQNKLKTYSKKGSISKLYYHPTFTKYLSGWLFKGIK